MSPFPRVIYRPLEPYAPDRRPVEVDLSDNTNRWGVHPAALRLLRQADPEDLLRYPPVYADGLREAVARRFGVPVEAVSTGCGSDDLLDSAFRAACDPGEGVRFVPPTFSMIEIFARMNALVPQPVEREAPAGPESPFGPLPDPERLFERAPGVVYLCRPNNPTGEVHPRAWVDRVVEEADRTGVVLLLDEAYADFMEGSTSDLLRRAAGTRRVVVLRTMSKAYGLAGLRVGFAVGAPEVVREMEKSRGPYKVSRLAEATARAALADEEDRIPELLIRVRQARRRLAEGLSERGLPSLPSGANFVCVPLAGTPLETGGGEEDADGPSPALAVTAALRDRGVAVRPFPDLPGMGDAVRVTLGPEDEMDALLQALDDLLS